MLISNISFQPSFRKGILFSFGSLSLLGVMPIISNSRSIAVDALSFAFYLSLWQFICSIPLFISEIRSDNKGIFNADVPESVKNSTWKVIFVTAIIFSITTYLYVLGFEKAGTVTAAIAIQTYPMFAIMIESFFFKGKKSKGEILFTLLLMIGIFYLGTEGTWIITGFSSWVLVPLLVPLLWSIAHTTIKNTLKNSPISPNQITFFRVIISSIVLFVLSSILKGPGEILNGLGSFEFQLSALFMGLFYYLELVSWFYAIKNVDVSIASSITTPTPIITMVLAILFLKESIETFEIISLAIVITSLYGILLFGHKKAQNQISGVP